jgi:beta-RFAP synthase
MLIEIGAPASLPLGLVQVDKKSCLLGLTLQHPPVQLSVQAYAGFKVTGARADIAHLYAKRFLEHYRLKRQVEVEIELAIPAFVGLGSEAILGLSVARALSHLNGEKVETEVLAQALKLGPQHALEVWGFDQGGLLLARTDSPAGQVPELVRRQEIAHPDKEAWAFVLHFPRVPAGTSERLETERLEALLQAAPHLSSESGHLVTDKLWPAVENDDLRGFAEALTRLQQLNEDALVAAGVSHSLGPDEQAVLSVMRENGALVCGQSATGMALYGLVKGSSATVALRHKLRDHVGHHGGIAMATIADNDGGRQVVKD